MTAKTLRDLAKGFASGELDREAYRQARSELLSAIVAGDVAVKPIDYPPLVHPPDAGALDQTAPRKKDQPAPSPGDDEPLTVMNPGGAMTAAASEAPTAEPTEAPTAEPTTTVVTPAGAPRQPADNRIWLYGGVATGLLLIILMIVLTGRGDSDGAADEVTGAPSVTAQQQTAASEGPTAADINNAATRLVRDFLRGKDWSGAGIDGFVEQWNLVPIEERRVAMDSIEITRLGNTIYRKLLEERALAGIGDPELSLRKQKRLVALAMSIGIDDPRIAVPDDS